MIGIILLASAHVSNAGLSLNSTFSDNMVLLKGALVPVWGLGDNRERIIILFHGQVVSTMVAEGKWTVSLQPLPYVTIPEDIVVVGRFP